MCGHSGRRQAGRLPRDTSWMDDSQTLWARHQAESFSADRELKAVVTQIQYDLCGVRKKETVGGGVGGRGCQEEGRKVN